MMGDSEPSHNVYDDGTLAIGGEKRRDEVDEGDKGRR